MTFTGNFVYIWLTNSTCYGSIRLTLGLIGMDGGLSTLVSYLRVCLSGEGSKNVSWPWLSPLRGWCCLTIAFTGKFVYIWLIISSCCGSILLTLGLIERDGSLSTLVLKLQVCLSAEGGINFFWPWLSPLRGWCCLTMAFTGKFVYIYIYIYIYIQKKDRRLLLI